MFNQAISDFNIDAQASISIGDKVTDIQAGYSAGIGKNLYLGVEDISNKKGIGNYLNIRHLNEACEHL
jgi:histidinol phosphatase-like enzyme